MHKNKWAQGLLAGLTLAFSLTGVGHAALVHYNEALDGDIAITSPLKTFVLDTAGSNTVSGTIGAIMPTGCQGLNENFDCDSFGFVVPIGMHLSSLSVTSTVPGTQWAVLTGLEDYDGDFIDFLLVGGTLLSNSLALGPGSYNISWDTLTVSDTGTPYTFTFDLLQDLPLRVPEPGTLPLVVLGLLGLLGLRGRARRR